MSLHKYLIRVRDINVSLPQTILHQHSIQGDLGACQTTTVRWLILLLKSLEKPIDPEVIYFALRDLERDWDRTKMTSSEEQYLGASFSLFIDVSMERIRAVLVEPPTKSRATSLECLVRSLSYLDQMKAFSGCCPFHKDIRTDLVMTVKKAATERYKLILLQDCTPTI